MESYPNSQMAVLYYDSEPVTDFRCSVNFSNGYLTISYEDEDDNGNTIITKYVGEERSRGHWELKGDDGENSRATLHQFDNGRILEGSWHCDNYSGMWRITLNK
ncbi:MULTISPECIES: hypothetical protein [unclassified Xenorhabdus]|uniref:hypothetical protein n=1 Tax=unclassified Xenorhabdus TaxID=2632833 RepID=UPI000C053875|nr:MULTISPECIES: hypothetical protein [unclassified Xenorhabdus]MCC8367940.1 hypothetical protein [Xenorhabdus sp. PB61.4]MCC8381607.1 hypothetical protein [Xenorhabdus sp. PB30.3]PHM55146.1 hypothetical protein Xekk_02408 [Xenorhabdus sp. KK7.4]